MLDIQTKKKLYSSKTAHEEPVRDIAMCDSQDMFVSCGYDAKVNIYDLRRCALVQQYKQTHPLSSVCVSSCGTFCVAGNLKGDCMTFDFRNMSQALAVKRVHNDAVVRVGFVPSITADLNTMHDSMMNGCADATVNSHYKSISEFMDMETPKPKPCDDWLEMQQAEKMHDFSQDSVMQTPAQWSFMSGDFQSRFIANHSTVSNNAGSTCDSTDNKPNKKERLSSSSSVAAAAAAAAVEPKRRRMTDVIALEEIAEEGSQIDKSSDDANAKQCARNVDHKQFAEGFAAYIRKKFDENNDVDMVAAKESDLKTQNVAITIDEGT